MKELSIFVDESGDFGEYKQHAPYYIITMVFHDQSNDISSNITMLFQVADLICTLELLKEKVGSGKLSKSEERFFHSVRDLKKDFLKGIKKKEF